MKFTANNRLSNKRLMVLIAILISLLCVIFFGAARQLNAPFATRIVVTTLAPFQAATSYVARGISGFRNYVGDVFYVYDQNRNLKAENDKLKLQLATLAETSVENKRLETLLNYKNTHREFDLLPATIIGRNSATWSNHVIINRGAEDGLKKYMPVITPNGLVGSINQVYGSYADVELITDPRSAVSAIVDRANSRVAGVVKGTPDSNSAINMMNIPQNADIKKGDLIITSGFGGIYPKGLKIGTVYKLEAASGGLLQYGILYPAVDFHRLEDVFVIRNYQHISPPIDNKDNTAASLQGVTP